MKIIEEKVQHLVCEDCESWLEPYDPSQERRYQEKYSCIGCGKLICFHCNFIAELHYKGYSFRMCKDCASKITLAQFIGKVGRR